MPGKIRFSSSVVWDILEYLQVKMLTWDCLSAPKELQILFVINCHISQDIKPATHCSSRISKVDIIWLWMEILHLHIHRILATNNPTAQPYTWLSLHPFQWAFITRLVHFPWSPSLKNDSSSINPCSSGRSFLLTWGLGTCPFLGCNVLVCTFTWCHYPASARRSESSGLDHVTCPDVHLQ